VIRAVVDTNVFVSALIAPTGNEALIVLAIRQGLVKPYFSGEILWGICGGPGPAQIRLPAG
jgi:predicted nucleic acid-binding protein